MRRHPSGFVVSGQHYVWRRRSGGLTSGFVGDRHCGDSPPACVLSTSTIETCIEQIHQLLRFDEPCKGSH